MDELGAVRNRWDITSDSDGQEQRLEELEDTVRKQQRRIDLLLEQNRRLDREKETAEKLIEGLLSSQSWRITAPLRRGLSVCRSFLPLFRFKVHRATLTPGRNILFRDGAFSAVGPSASIALRTEALLPTGWLEIDAKLISEQQYIIFYLLPRSTRGFDESRRVALPFEAGVTTTHLVKLDSDIEALRLDPFNADTAFSFEQFSIRELGKVQAIYRIIKAKMVPALRHPPTAFRKVRTLGALLREGGLAALKQKLSPHSGPIDYGEWVRKFDSLADSDRTAIRWHITRLQRCPLISIILPVYNTPERWLRAALDSVLCQLYERWELCVADDASSEPHVRRVLEEYRARDSRIKIVYREKNGHIAEASNSALALAEGEYVALLDHDDEMREHALYMNAVEINRFPEAALIYSDEDKITGYGLRFNPYFKSDWNAELFLAQNFVCHLSVYKTETVRRLGGFRAGFDGAQDWDLALRVVDVVSEDQIRHIPHILYHWRVIEGSTAQSTLHKPYVMEAQAKAVREHLERRGVKGAKVEILHQISQLRVRYPLPDPAPLVSLIIPTRDQVRVLRQCITSILTQTSYPNFEIILVDNGSVEDETAAFLLALRDDGRVRIIRDDAPFNFSRLNNRAAASACGELIGLLNNDLEVINADWLSEMVSYAVQPGIGAVGARLLYPNGLLQHAGVILGIGGVGGHNHKGRPKHDPGYFNRAILPQDLSAVTAACLLMQKRVFLEVGGLDEDELAVAFNDVDLCLKAVSRGYRIVYTPYAELYHHESVSRGYENTPAKFGRFEREIETMKQRWGDALKEDPYYNPNLTLLREDFSLAFPPRAERAWVIG